MNESTEVQLLREGGRWYVRFFAGDRLSVAVRRHFETDTLLFPREVGEQDARRMLGEFGLHVSQVVVR